MTQGMPHDQRGIQHCIDSDQTIEHAHLLIMHLELLKKLFPFFLEFFFSDYSIFSKSL